jgi:hypothetical protein
VFTASQSKNQPLRKGERKKREKERKRKRRQQTEALCLHISIAFGA